MLIASLFIVRGGGSSDDLERFARLVYLHTNNTLGEVRRRAQAALREAGAPVRERSRCSRAADSCYRQ